MMNENKKCKSRWGHDWSHYWNREDDQGRFWDGITCRRCDLEIKQGYHRNESVEYPIYMCTAPFGLLVNKLKGSGSGNAGGWFLGWSGTFSLNISNDLKEYYIVKYFVGKRLMTKTFEAEDAVVIVDGKFVLEREYEQEYKPDGTKGRDNYNYWGNYIIHLPELLEPTKEITDNFPNFERVVINRGSASTKKEEEV